MLRIRQTVSAVVIICLLISSLPFPVHAAPGETERAFPAVQTSADAAVLLDVTGGGRRVIWSRNGEEKMRMASTTKIMTALVAIESLPLSTQVTVPAGAVGVEGSSVYLVEGEVLSLEQLLYCMLLESANDAATAIALTVAGSIEAFADMMNAKVSSLGLTATHFCNPHGLDADGHYTTAHDLACIAAAALENPQFAAITSTYKTVIPNTATGGARLLVNHNRLLRSYEGSIGVKTGFTRASGRCLVSAAERDGVRLVAVTLDDPNDWHDHTAMLDAGFAFFECIRLTSSDGQLCSPGGQALPPVSVINGEQSSVRCCTAAGIQVTLPRGHGAVICRVELPRSLPAPVYAGDAIGKVSWYCDGQLIAECDIAAEYSAARKPAVSFWLRLWRWLGFGTGDG